MKWLLHIGLNIWCITTFGQVISICSWNIKDFGKSKNDTELEFIANTVRAFDIVAIQEVVAGEGGAQAVAKLSDVLNRKGAKWDYVISKPTASSPYSSERYAFLWKPKVITRISEAFLDKKFCNQIDREPFIAKFKIKGKTITLLSFHATTKAKLPEQEIKYLKFFPALYKCQAWIFAGDFNLSQRHSVFNPLKDQGFAAALINQKTSLKQKCVNGEYLASELDNFLYNKSKFKYISAGIIPIYSQLPNIKKVREVSDHVPIFFKFSMN